MEGDDTPIRANIMRQDNITQSSGMGCIENNMLGFLSKVYWNLLQRALKSAEDGCILMDIGVLLKKPF